MLAIRILPVIVFLGACGNEPIQPRDIHGWQAFSLGGEPFDYSLTGEKRYIVSVPRKYIDIRWLPDPLVKDAKGRILANAIRFGIMYPSMKPAEDAWVRGAARITIGNITENGISRSVDGSWLNYYSGFTINLPDKFGMHVRKRADRDPLDRHIYFRIAAQNHVRIECTDNLTDRKRWCVMIAKRPNEPYIETGFYFTELPHWEERLRTIRTLFRSEGKQPLEKLSKS